VAIPSPDAALLQLFDEYMSTVTEHRRVYGLYERRRAKQQAKHPRPEAMFIQPGDVELGLPQLPEGAWSGSYEIRIRELSEAEWPVIEEFEPPAGWEFRYACSGQTIRYEAPSTAARARADEIIEAYDGWHDNYWHETREMQSLDRQHPESNCPASAGLFLATGELRLRVQFAL
jgi:hypothetical protein